MQLVSAKFLGCVLALFVLVLPAQAAFISGGGPISPSSNPALGRFLAELTVVPVGPDANLTIRIRNTSLAGTGGFLNAFVFNNPAAYTVALTSSTVNTFRTFVNENNDIKAPPLGDFDFLVGTDNSFTGGGNGQGGLGVGQSATFVFSVTGANASTLTDDSFLTALSEQKKPKVGELPQFFAARFQGFKDGGSDKVAAVRGLDAGGGNVGGFAGPEVNPVPAPASLVLAAMGIPLFLLPRLRRRATITA